MILLTGASGFVGSAVLRRLAAEPASRIRVALRHPGPALEETFERVIIEDVSAGTDWTTAVTGVDTVVHSAARVHVMRDSAADPLAEFRRVNVGGTLRLARQAAKAGVRRFVFLSSIKVNGERTSADGFYTAADVPAPVDAYGVSKQEAEQGLRQLSRDTGLEVVIIRPVLVYGPGVKANFRAMMRWLHRGLPLPLGATHNLRSFVAVDNLVDLVALCVVHPAAANQTFLVSDDEDLSTAELLRRTAAALGRRARLLPVPPLLLTAAACALGKREVADRLLGSLRVDIAKTRSLLGWTPPVGVDEALARTAAHYLKGDAR